MEAKVIIIFLPIVVGAQNKCLNEYTKHVCFVLFDLILYIPVNKLSVTSGMGLPELNQYYSRRVVVSYKRKYVHKLLVNRLFKPAQEKVWLSELTVPQ